MNSNLSELNRLAATQLFESEGLTVEKDNNGDTVIKKEEIPTLLWEILGIDPNQYDPNTISDSSYNILYNYDILGNHRNIKRLVTEMEKLADI